MPLPDTGPHRAAPHGHSGATAGLLSAQLKVTITAKAPLLVRGFGTDDVPTLPTRPSPDGQGRVAFLPGSGLHGAIRSLHETLTGSCLRVLDDEMVPSYRQQADGGEVSRLRLALVTYAPKPARRGDPHPPPTVRLCEHPADPLRFRLGMGLLTRMHKDLEPTGGLRSGTRLSVTVPHNEDERLQATPDPNGEWVVFISDDKARDHRHAYKAAVRKLTGVERTVPDGVWSDFLAAVELADDLRPERLKQEPEVQRWSEVRYEHAPVGMPVSVHAVGMRSLARRTVHRDQPVWVMVDEQDNINQLRLAQIWREPGTFPVSDRVGDHRPCTDPENLCPSCRLFGSADVTGPADGATEQRSYRGHVRFTDAVATGPVQSTEVSLPPLGRPRPGSGQFYLENPSQVVGNAARGIPLREWGSRADEPVNDGPRRIRGRKFYWHTVPEPGRLPARGRSRPGHDQARRSTPAVLFPAGTTFTATVSAIDVDAEQLGSLLAALDPAPVLDQTDALVSLGGGRPLGYGSCRITIDAIDSQVWTSASRYGAGAWTTTEALLEESRAAFAKTRAQHHRTWECLGKVLSATTVEGENVWYPPGPGRPRSDTYDVGFPFWKQSSGKELRREGATRMGHPLTPLPSVTEPDQAMTVVERAASVPLPNQKELR